mmetsp:Transcript_7551/g.14280  ORF Transcript_7551/g.14280 Transcript_7551/m.14280 type:complete len:246 (+) Transcript_7551:990-1727(+)
MGAAHIEGVEHVQAVKATGPGHPEPLLEGSEIEPELVVAWSHHVGHTRSHGLDLAHKHIPVLHVSIGVADIAVVQHHINFVGLHQSGQSFDGVVRCFSVSHIAYTRHTQRDRLAYSLLESGEREDITPPSQLVSHLIEVPSAWLEACHGTRVQLPVPPKVSVSVVRSAAGARQRVRLRTPLDSVSGCRLQCCPHHTVRAGLIPKGDVNLLRLCLAVAAVNGALASSSTNSSGIPRQRTETFVHLL